MFEWDPFDEFEKIEKKMRESFKRMFEEVEDVEPGFSTVRSMRFQVSDEGDNLVINAELPGFKKEDVGVRLTENSVEIAAHRKEERREQTKKMFRAEQSMNSIRRMMSLPESIDSRNAKVEFENGVLTIRAPKKVSRNIKKEVR